MAIYIDNVRKSIKRIIKKNKDWKEYKRIVRESLKKKYGVKVKPKTLEDTILQFVAGRKPRTHYLESYLLAFDTLFYNGAAAAIQNKEMKKPKNWRELLITITDDLTLPSEAIKHLEHEEILLQLKTMFYRSIVHCNNKDKDEFARNLHNFIQFLSINKFNNK
ncbi:hypothetical protein ABE65_000915 [Fictibacillus phosphorivorans]|uniref:Uncharacterized protein n=1 Tax=Fictibacillus phosphorivorans TaxID=1221500 RepID=A0A168VQ51_9BACL|nr:hypothetical protein [Fictibacillus phosphorivorans]ANC75499.1 hypothetical protein ABE65_000915 [Fictibacillus phosphorivorans]